jgi:exodeoxyribonuclease-3
MKAHMKLATWNVNSLNVRLPHVMKWLEENPTDVLCIQETKLTDDKFPLAAIEAAGYHVAYTGQKTYNGVAIISRLPMTDIVKNNPKFEDPQQRILAATIDGVRVVCAYVPNGQAIGSEKFDYKMAWLNAFHDWIKEQAAQYPQLVVAGDYNIAPEDRDVRSGRMGRHGACVAGARAAAAPAGYRPDRCLPHVRAAGQIVQLVGLSRPGLPPEQRLAHRSPAVGRAQQRCSACIIDRVPRKWEQPSDHTPVVATFD